MAGEHLLHGNVLKSSLVYPDISDWWRIGTEGETSLVETKKTIQTPLLLSHWLLVWVKSRGHAPSPDSPFNTAFHSPLDMPAEAFVFTIRHQTASGTVCLPLTDGNWPF